MSLHIFLLCLVWIPIFLSNSQSTLTPPTDDDNKKFHIDCGGGVGGHTAENGLRYVSDESFISVGKKAALDNASVAIPLLATLRYFPELAARKYCFAVPAESGRRYLVRTTYFYGGFDGGDLPPVFDQVVEGTALGEVDTAEDYKAGLGSYYEAVVAASGRQLSVCLVRSERTPAERSPFISALEVEPLEDSIYNATDFDKFALRTVARTNFGTQGHGYIGFPEDKFNRLWEPFKDENPVVTSHVAVDPARFWNLPPGKAFGTGITASRGKSLRVRWPPQELPAAEYHVVLYFQDNRTPSPYSWRIFDVWVGGQLFYAGLNVTTDGAIVYSPRWPLVGPTEIVLNPAPAMPVGPVISAAEILQVLPLGGKTLPSDEDALIELAGSFKNPPVDWSHGDPCLPQRNSWTGVTCSNSGKLARITSLELTGKGVSGTLHSSIAKLTALNHIWLGGNKLTGHIPEMGSLEELQTLHLENNHLEGSVPDSLGYISKLHEIFLQNNNLDRRIPASLHNRKGVTLKM